MNEFEQLVALVTEKVLERLKQTEAEESGTALFILGKATDQLVQQLTADCYRIVTQCDETTSLCLAELSVGRLARIAMLIPNDSEEEWIVAQLMAKKEVLVNYSGRTYGPDLRTCPYSMKKKISQFEELWRDYGAVFIRTQESQTKKLLSVKEVQEAVKEGQQTISVTKKTIITPLAKDYIKAYQLRLINK